MFYKKEKILHRKRSTDLKKEILWSSLLMLTANFFQLQTLLESQLFLIGHASKLKNKKKILRQNALECVYMRSMLLSKVINVCDLCSSIYTNTPTYLIVVSLSFLKVHYKKIATHMQRFKLFLSSCVQLLIRLFLHRLPLITKHYYYFIRH